MLLHRSESDVDDFVASLADCDLRYIHSIGSCNIMTDAPQQSSQSATAVKRGHVKQVLSGDAVVLQGPPVNGPPKEITVYLSNINAPRLAKRPNDGQIAAADEPFAWEAREFLRKKVVGQTVTFVRDFTATSGREHGRIYLGGTSVETAENVAETGISEGYYEVRTGKQVDEYTQKLLDLQEQAKAGKKGRWAFDEQKLKEQVRNVKWTAENPRGLVDSLKHKPVKAVIEQVRDGSTVRAFLLPDFQYVTVMLSGLKAPGVRAGSDGRPEEFSEEAKYFVEYRLLQRDVEIVLEGVSNQNFVGSVIHPKGNIAEILLKEGFAKCVDWSIGMATCGAPVLRAAEKIAKDKKLRLWKSYKGSSSSGDKKSFTARVVEIVLGDSMIVQKEDGEESKIFLSSVRPPRLEAGADKQSVGRQFRPLYDIPHMFEAREFLRKRLVGKKVNVSVDYVQPKSEQFPEKTCCTVTAGGQNIAEVLISRGLAKVVRHRGDDENRSVHYDALLAAETKAEQAKKGLFADADPNDNKSVLRIQELSGDVQRSKQFLPYLQRSARSEGVVEFISSGSRLRLYVPKETCIITFLLGGVSCPRSARTGPGGKIVGENEPYAEEALKFTRSKCLQHEVQIEVETMDKAGGFVGYMFVPNEKGGFSNLSELLVENGLATVHYTAERSSYYNQLAAAEERARKARLNIWKDYKEEKQVEHSEQEETVDRKINYKKVVVTEVVKGSLNFACQTFDDGPKIVQLMRELQQEMNASAIAGSYTPRRNELAAAKFSGDKQWHRVRVEGAKAGMADVYYIDFGNRETLPVSEMATLPSRFAAQAPGAHEYQLALVTIPNDPHYAADTDAVFENSCFSHAHLLLNVEYKVGGKECATLTAESADGTKNDIGKTLVAEGHALVDQRREKRLQQLVTEYTEAEQKARRARKNIWEYGDFTGRSKIVQLMRELQQEMNASAIAGSYTPRRNELAAAKFSGDKQWHRVRVEGAKAGMADVYYIDFGNRETLPVSEMATLPSRFAAQAPGAHEYQLALVTIPNDPHYAADTDAVFENSCFSHAHLLLNVEYKVGGKECATLTAESADGTKNDIGKTLVAEGHALVDQRREKRLQQLVTEYTEAEQKARRARKNIWEYGDFTGSEI
ncbi:hypothetical protein QR680_001139 [Steinernema hermaphroditum]|uniref:Staphylococcal nuclease domain-containing protein 1 n=1 Tax=Steinernema hermaphroditum TaxID=289476 RepID=A0AA39GX29_9BILA|nr:hypothetical protein QR680_001139 [Steinernema hermaphroditum]